MASSSGSSENWLVTMDRKFLVQTAHERREIVLAADTARQEAARASQAERDRTLAFLNGRKLQAAASEGK